MNLQQIKKVKKILLKNADIIKIDYFTGDRLILENNYSLLEIFQFKYN